MFEVQYCRINSVLSFNVSFYSGPLFTFNLHSHQNRILEGPAGSSNIYCKVYSETDHNCRSIKVKRLRSSRKWSNKCCVTWNISKWSSERVSIWSKAWRFWIKVTSTWLLTQASIPMEGTMARRQMTNCPELSVRGRHSCPCEEPFTLKQSKWFPCTGYK